jgi:ribosomal protein L19E
MMQKVNVSTVNGVDKMLGRDTITGIVKDHCIQFMSEEVPRKSRLEEKGDGEGKKKQKKGVGSNSGFLFTVI